MNDLKYHTVPPQNAKTSYGQNETIDFKTSAFNRKLVGGSVRLLGDISVSLNSALTSNVFYDGFAGLHCVLDSIKTSFSSVGQVENLDHYNHYVASKAKASLTKHDLFNSVYVCEGRCPDDVLAKKLLKGTIGVNNEGQGDIAAYKEGNLDFALKLDFCLNNMVGDSLVPFNKIGDVMISIQTASILNALWGSSDLNIGTNYTLQNLRLIYTSVADDGKDGKYSMKIKSSVKTSLQSNNATISTKVPVVADSFFMTFIQQLHEGSRVYNSLQCEKIPLFERLEVTYNDSMSQQFTYEIDNEEEVLTNYIKAVQKVAGNNDASLSTLASNEAYGVGFNFGSFVDLSKTKIGINIKSGIQSAAPFLAYMFFNGVITI
jgi:hypothetical protein